MKTKYFIKKVEALGHEVVEKETWFGIKDTDGSWLALVGKDHILELSTDFPAWRALSIGEKVSLFTVIYEYASTLVDEREEEKKFYLKHRWLRSRFEDKIVNQDGEDEYFLSDESQIDGFKTQFTQKEIDDIKEKYNTDLSDFERVEVEE